MRYYDFGRLEGSRIKISERLGKPLGLVDGSQVFSTMFMYEHEGKSSYELVLSTLGPENYRQICTITFNMIDTPGACDQVAKFLGERNIDILNSSSLSMISNICMVWKMMADLSYYGDSAGLREEFDTLKRQRSASLSKVDSIEIEASNVSDRYTKGVAAPGSSVKARSMKQYRKTNSIIKNGTFQVPEDYLRAIDNLAEGQPVMMVADQDSWILSITPLNPKSRLAELDFLIPDKPGAIHEITKALADQNINLLSVSTKVLVYYETMSMSIVADVSNYAKDLEALRTTTEANLAKLNGKFSLARIAAIEL
jgi:predicted amino acid-binding ACT domain protein